ncbi:glycosyltransferase [Deinococcus sp. 23YEL01]|uniref:glycosyltransferase n=1 Tax=Deinococcus sp. 23YEL01 TaxID=2745871 RepID=UPI001E436A7A|nr:glycosyltransferase [Deinococcus sp. 23YEL01]MCD0169101.1 glycosyltransferase [Deinococcus sp. 23YEL01]
MATKEEFYGEKMQHKSEITVVIPVFNAEEYIKDAINSVFNQTYKNWQLIIMDDGSTDNSLKIASEFTDPRIKVISDGRNRGLSYRLNESVKLATGEFYARMDADDIMCPDRLDRQIAYMLENPDCDLVGSAAYIINGANQITGLRGGNPFIDTGFLSVLKYGGFMHPTVLGRTAWFKSNPYDTTAERCEDIELWLRTADQSHFGQISEPLLFYREEGDQSAKVEKTSAGYIKVLKKMLVVVKPEHHPFLRKQLLKSHARIRVRRIAHALGFENRIVAARSTSLTQTQRQAAENRLQHALATAQARES